MYTLHTTTSGAGTAELNHASRFPESSRDGGSLMSVTGITPPSSSKSREEREAAEPGSPRVVPRVWFAFFLSKSKIASDFMSPVNWKWLNSSDKKRGEPPTTHRASSLLAQIVATPHGCGNKKHDRWLDCRSPHIVAKTCQPPTARSESERVFRCLDMLSVVDVWPRICYIRGTLRRNNHARPMCMRPEVLGAGGP